MKKLFALSFIVLLTLVSCEELCVEASTNLEMRTIGLAPFSGITHKLSGHIDLRRGESKASVILDDNLFDDFDLSVTDDELVIGSKNTSCFNPSDLDIVVFSNVFSNIQSDGSADWTCDPLRFDPKIIHNGSGYIALKGISSLQIIVLNGSGDVDLFSMPTEDAQITVNGSGMCKVKVSRDAVVEVNGSGDTYITDIEGKLTVTITGSGNVYYSGEPEEIVSSIHGSGNIIKQ